GNHLDDEYLLTHLNVKAIIESKSYSASHQGENGNVVVKAAFSIANPGSQGPVIHRDLPMRIKLSRGSPNSGLTNSGSTFTTQAGWPGGLNPITIDIIASIEHQNSSIRRIRVFDRITKTDPNSNSNVASLSVGPLNATVAIGRTVTFTATALDAH